MQHAEPMIDRGGAAAGRDSLEKLAIDLLDIGEDLALPGQGFARAETLRALDPVVDGNSDLVLRLDEMVGDGNDEVVLLDDSGLSHLALSGDVEVVAEGTAVDHVTADGQDVSGFAFVTFASGMTLFYPDGVELALFPGS